MKKKFDIHKFLEFFKYDVSSALADSKQEEFEGPYFTKKIGKTPTQNDVDGYFLFEDLEVNERIEKDFQILDKSFRYSPILQIREAEYTPEVRSWNQDYYFNGEYGFLSTQKSKYSYLIRLRDYNQNIELILIKKFININKDTKFKLSNLVLKDLPNQQDGLGHCQYIVLNNSYLWGTQKEYNFLMSDKPREPISVSSFGKIPKSLKKHFLPLLEEKIKFLKGSGYPDTLINKGLKDYSGIMILSEDKIKKKKKNINLWGHTPWYPYPLPIDTEGEGLEYLNK